MFDCKLFVPGNIQCSLKSFEQCSKDECRKYNKCKHCKHSDKCVTQHPCATCNNLYQKTPDR